MEQDNLKDNSNTNNPGECHMVQVVSKTKVERNVGIDLIFFSGVHAKRRILINNCIMERLSVKIINCKYLPACALAVTTNYDLPP